MDLTKLRTNNFLDISEPSTGASPDDASRDNKIIDKQKDSPISTNPWSERSTGERHRERMRERDLKS